MILKRIKTKYLHAYYCGKSINRVPIIISTIWFHTIQNKIYRLLYTIYDWLFIPMVTKTMFLMAYVLDIWHITS